MAESFCQVADNRLLGRGGTFDPIRPPQPGGGDLAFLNGRYPRPPVPVQGMHLPDRS
jgi:hypothetical protein